ncbi:hypothetical protein UAW_00906 [Enterococcus haemoperoxidus ATCC BAA-382]|uniref:Uncharacterized protein n=1 Tax=Enterococcus haemoperoxidus ATCC BAA-382 TaxID=1158608 RepID=R2QWK2_9ENTE|nr:hypothetical protein [Enterococcus haemoperoxidus]EOH99753.1 hypothetical protein UAW_00906 [Enterococcus haemoperoxidus ATCC BAA-382]EOT62505.1 hypothetical protein I583_01505 [Enterococcus haemoperoxidus ATCC BAA-382]OJG54362.1 hypothetical protein RV06_GL003030 [Enterococcus haemoperoxidus]
MNQMYIDILIDAIIEQFETEEHFYTDYLQITKENWDNWKKGRINLTNEEMQKVKNLFSDYEWMLTQKILRQTILFPEKRNIAVSEYKRLKTLIAKKWLQSGAGIAELIPSKASREEKEQAFIDLKVTVSYGEWGFDDIVTFRLPARLQGQLEGSKVELLDWVNENLMGTYVGE